MEPAVSAGNAAITGRRHIGTYGVGRKGGPIAELAPYPIRAGLGERLPEPDHYSLAPHTHRGGCLFGYLVVT
jgi:hypothetical protein